MKHINVTCFTLLYCLTAFPAHARVWYAKPNANGDGESWSTAANVRAILSKPTVAAGDEVWVAAGRHYWYPALVLKEGVSLYGGFAGAETSRDERDPSANETRMEGYWANTVIHAGPGITEATVVDGFTITKGGGHRVYGYEFPRHVSNYFHMGGGLFIEGSPTISNNIITGNDTTLHEQVDPYNVELPGDGGGIYIKSGSPRIVDNTIAGNRAKNGGGILVAGGNPLIRGNRIIANETTSTEASAYVKNGGGIAIMPSPSGSSVTGGAVTDNIISGNSAARGGGIHTQSWNIVHITRNRISGNSAQKGGGLSNTSRMEVISNVIDGNTATVSGGGVYSEYAGLLRNNTIAGNTSPMGAVYLTAINQASLVNNIIAGNSTGVAVSSPQNIVMTSSDVFRNGDQNYMGLPDKTGTGGNISADPLFLDLPNGDYRLRTGSPALDAGTDTGILPDELDFSGQPRTQGPHVDMGAHESLVVDQAAFANAIRALRIAGGADAYQSGTDGVLDLVQTDSVGPIDFRDAAAWARKACGLQP